MSASGGVLARLRQPEYTGENRCLPCTAVNAVIAVTLAIVAGVALVLAGGTPPGVGLAVGLLILGVSGAAIYLRGYLVPGTPRLTKRYLPERVLALFGKTPDHVERDGSDATGAEFDPEQALVAAGALTECADRDDLCLTDGFRADWTAAIDGVREDAAGREELLTALDVEDGEVTYEEYGEAFRARVDGTLAGRWESRAAFLADVGAARVLTERHPGWERLGIRERSQLLDGLRLFLESCPACGATPEFGTQTVESCCTSHQVAAVSCPDCGARLFESDPV